jgi:biopolymer transport protein ExbB
VLEEQLNHFAAMGAGWVLWLLVGLSVLCVAVAIERLIVLMLGRSPEGPLMDAMQACLDGGPLAALKERLAAQKGVEATVLRAGVDAGLRGGAEAAQEALTGTSAIEKAKLDRRLIVLGTVGSNAPFIGLFGTVLGIIQAFRDLALDSDDGASAVMAGISEALIATAVGLIVAIPAVVLYNFFQRLNKERMARITYLSHMLLSRLRDAPAAGGA